MRYALVIGLLSLGLSGSVFADQAIHGYKNIPFGITVAQLKKLAKCSVHLAPLVDQSKNKTYMCTDFKLNGRKTEADFYFIGQKLLRILIATGSTATDFMTDLSVLMHKYGPPTYFNQEDFQNFDAGRVDAAEADWGDGAISLKIARIQLSINVVGVIYSDPSYDNAIISQNSKGLENSL